MLDWELATVGDPLLDLGWLLATWPEKAEESLVRPWAGFPDRAQLIADYQGNSDKDVTYADWYEVLACYKLGIILEGTYARACAGLVDRKVGDRLHGRALHLLTKAARRIQAS